MDAVRRRRVTRRSIAWPTLSIAIKGEVLLRKKERQKRGDFKPKDGNGRASGADDIGGRLAHAEGCSLRKSER